MALPLDMLAATDAPATAGEVRDRVPATAARRPMVGPLVGRAAKVDGGGGSGGVA